MAEKIPAWQTALLSAGNAVTLGYLPQLATIGSDTSAADYSKMIQEAKAQNPTASTIGTGVGYGLGLLGIGKAIKGAQLAGRALNFSAALPALATRIGAEVVKRPDKLATMSNVIGPVLATNVPKTLLNVGLKSGRPLGKLAGLGTIYSVASADNPPATTPDNTETPGTPGTPGMSEQPQSTKSAYEQNLERWSTQLGLDPSEVDAIAKRYGGIPVDLAEKLVGMQPKAPGYKDSAYSTLEQIYRSQLATLEQQGASKEQIAAYRDRLAQQLQSILGADALGSLLTEGAGTNQ
jgi:hypothetical protein